MFAKGGTEPLDVRPNMRGGNGQTVLQPVMPQEAMHRNLRVMSVITLEPGCSIGVHEHVGETEIYYMLEGVASVMDDDAPVTAYPGDVVVTPSGHSHSISNDGESVMRLLAVIVKD